MTIYNARKTQHTSQEIYPQSNSLRFDAKTTKILVQITNFIVINVLAILFIALRNELPKVILIILLLVLSGNLLLLQYHSLTSKKAAQIITIVLVNSISFSILLVDNFFPDNINIAPNLTAYLRTSSVVLLPTMLCIYFFSNIKSGVRSLTISSEKFMVVLLSNYKFILIVLFIFLCFSVPRLNYYILGDEFLQFNAAAGFLKSGQFKAWDFIENTTLTEYDRAWPSTVIIAGSQLLLGISEFSARIPVLVAGLITLLACYYLTYLITGSNKTSKLILLFFATNSWFIWYSTFIRMYIFLMLGMVLFFIALIKSYSFTENKVDKKYFALSVIMLLYSLLLHRAALSTIPLLILYLIYIAFYHFRRQIGENLHMLIGFCIFYFFLSLIIVPQALTFVLYKYRGYFDHNPTLEFNPISIASFFSIPFYTILILLVVFWMILIIKSKSVNRPPLIFLLIFGILPHFMYILLADENHARYIAHLLPINIIVIIYTLLKSFEFIKIRSNTASIMVAGILIISNVILFTQNKVHNGNRTFENPFTFKAMYYIDPTMHQWENYAIAESVIQKYYQPGMPVIGESVMNRSYYFQNAFKTPFNYFNITTGTPSGGLSSIETQKPIDHIRMIVNSSPQGMFIWATRKENSIYRGEKADQLKNYIINNPNITKVSGLSIDESFIEIYVW